MRRLYFLSLCLIGLSAPALAQSVPSLTPVSADQASDASDASDQPSGPPVPSKDVLAAFLKTCTDVSSGDPKAYDRATADGWTPDEPAQSGPHRTIYSATKDVSGYDSAVLWGSVDSYPTQRLGYCRVDFGDYDSHIDFNDMQGLGGLTGSVTAPDTNGDVFGAWETPDKKLLVIADRSDGQVEIEYNILLGPKP
jgi:hypothetical protein